MEIRLATGDPLVQETPLLVLIHFEGDELDGDGARADERVAGLLSRAIADGDFGGKSGQSLLIQVPGGDARPRRLLVLGGGSREACKAEGVRRLAARAVREAEKLSLDRITVRIRGADGVGDEALGQAAAEGAVLAGWQFRELKTGRDEDDPPAATVEVVELSGTGDAARLGRGVEIGRITADAENFARTLQARPGNVATPTHLGETAEALADDFGLEVRVLGPEEIRKEEMHALLAVSLGSDQEPRFIILRHAGGPEGQAPLVLVGKGLTFDAGGISIKPASGMEDMKFDMSGGAAVIAAMRGIAALGVKRNVVGLVPSSENLINGSAVKPGDVIRTREGKTVEVVNTDAEGRLILADALSYAQSLEPEAVVDCATLTGSCVVALGHHAAAVLGTDEGLIDELRGAGDRSGERCWPLPLWPEYRRQLTSTSADLMNVGGRPGGTITAACFLREFVGDVPWAHLDIAGTAYGEGKLPYQRKGGAGFPTRLLIEWVRTRAG